MFYLHSSEYPHCYPPAQDFPIRMNDLIAGRYQVMDFLGAAAFSRAVQALDIKTNTLVCLKIVKVRCSLSFVARLVDVSEKQHLELRGRCGNT